MTPELFVAWCDGFVKGADGKRPNAEQWVELKRVLRFAAEPPQPLDGRSLGDLSEDEFDQFVDPGHATCNSRPRKDRQGGKGSEWSSL